MMVVSYATVVAHLLVIFATFKAYQYLRRKRDSVQSLGTRGTVEIVTDYEEPEVDLVAIHGLGSHPDFTWTTKSPNQPLHSSRLQHTQKLVEDGSSTAALTSRVNWLKDDQFLKRDFERLRVLKYNYNSDYLFGASTSTPQDKAETLLRELVKKRGASKAPIIFVGHSLGGIILKYAVCTAHNRQEYKDIFDSTAGLIFLGTPHQGSFVALLATFLTRLTTSLGSSPTFPELLQLRSVQLWELKLRFKAAIQDLFSESREKVYSFYESRNTRLFNVINLGTIVDRFSATLDIGRDIEVDKNHSELNKCYGRNDKLYQDLREAVRGIRAAWYTIFELDKRDLEVIDRSLHFRRIDSRLEDLENEQAQRRDTCRWLRDVKEVKEWFDWSMTTSGTLKNRYLYLTGNAGSGKSVAMYSLMKFLSVGMDDRAARSNEIRVSFYFDARPNVASILPQSYCGMLRSLLRQLLKQLKYLPENLASELHEVANYLKGPQYSSNEDNPENDSLWTKEKLQHLLRLAFQSTPNRPLKLRIFIDAVDECTYDDVYRGRNDRNVVAGTAVREFMKSLLENTHESIQIKACISIRQGNKSFPGTFPIGPTVSVNNHNVIEIERYVRYTLSATSMSLETSNYLLDKLLAPSPNLFLWVKLVLQRILDGDPDTLSPVELDEMFKDIPHGLSQYYEQILSLDKLNQRSTQSQYISFVFQLVLFSRRPITTDTLRSALPFQTESFSQKSAEWELAKRNRPRSGDPFVKRIINDAAGLLETYETEIEGKHRGISFRVIHDSVRTFLLEEPDLGLRRLDPKLVPRSNVELGYQCHMNMLGLCLQVAKLEEEISEPDGSEAEFVNLLEYSGKYWAEHARMCEELIITEAGRRYVPEESHHQELFQVISDCGHALALKLVKASQCYPSPSQSQSMYLRREASILVFMAASGCTKLLRPHVESCICVRNSTAPSVLDRALYHATVNSKPSTIHRIRDIVDHNPDLPFDPNSQHWMLQNTPLFMASRLPSNPNGLEIVKLLLDMGAKTSQQTCWEFRTPVHAASMHGRIESLQELLKWAERGDVEATARRIGGKTPIEVAIQWRQYGSAKMLADFMRRHRQNDMIPGGL